MIKQADIILLMWDGMHDRQVNTAAEFKKMSDIDRYSETLGDSHPYGLDSLYGYCSRIFEKNPNITIGVITPLSNWLSNSVRSVAVKYLPSGPVNQKVIVSYIPNEQNGYTDGSQFVTFDKKLKDLEFVCDMEKIDVTFVNNLDDII